MSRPQLVGKVAERILRAVADGTWPPGSTLPSIRQLAPELGVSTCTVLAALKQVAREGLLDVHQGRPARVLAGADERARQLLTPVTEPVCRRRVAILISDHYQPLTKSPFYAGLVSQITHEAEKQGLEATVVWWNTREQLAVAESLSRTGYDAAMFVGFWTDYLASVFVLHERKFPVLIYNYEIPALRLSTVIEDLHGAAQNIGRHLMKLGHRNLCLVVKHETLFPARGLGRGWMDFLAENDLLAKCTMPVYTPVEYLEYNIGAYNRQFRDMMRSPDRPTAIVFANNFWAGSFLQDQEFSRFRVPEELSLATFDSIAKIPVTPQCPVLSNLDINYTRTAQCLVETIQKMFAGDPHPSILRVKLDLTVTESMGPPP